MSNGRLTDREGKSIPPPEDVFCIGHYLPGHPRAGQKCTNAHPLATVYGGTDGYIEIKYSGRTTLFDASAPASTTCPKCKNARHFRDGVPEELGGSSGYLADGELRGVRAVA